jgi:predicted small integral membrane protein
MGFRETQEGQTAFFVIAIHSYWTEYVTHVGYCVVSTKGRILVIRSLFSAFLYFGCVTLYKRRTASSYGMNRQSTIRPPTAR